MKCIVGKDVGIIRDAKAVTKEEVERPAGVLLNGGENVVKSLQLHLYLCLTTIIVKHKTMF